MPIALDLPGGEFEYVLKCDRELPEGQHVRWKMRPLKEGERRRLEDLKASRLTYRPDGSFSPQRSNMRIWIETLQCGLLDVEGFKDKGGVEVGVKRHEGGRITDDFFARLRNDDLEELSDEIWDRTVLTQEQVKNS